MMAKSMSDKHFPGGVGSYGRTSLTYPAARGTKVQQFLKQTCFKEKL